MGSAAVGQPARREALPRYPEVTLQASPPLAGGQAPGRLLDEHGRAGRRADQGQVQP